MTAPATAPPAHGARRRTGGVFAAMLLRDFTVLNKGLGEFLASALIQPFMLVFVFTYMLPRMGMAVGGGDNADQFSTLLLGGMVAQAIIFEGIFRVAVPLALELEMTGELEDRVLAPASVTLLAMEKITAGALQGVFAGLVVFPVAAFVPATPINLAADWVVLATVAPLVCYTSAALGLTLGTCIEPRRVPTLSNYIALPLAFLGAIFYTWDSLQYIPWLRYAVLVNPLVYMSEGFRAGLATDLPHMPLAAVYGVLGVSAVVLTVLGVRGFRRRVLS